MTETHAEETSARFQSLAEACLGQTANDHSKLEEAHVDFALRLAQERGDAQQVKKLKQQGSPPYYGNDVALKSATYLMETFNYMAKNPAIVNQGFNTLQDIAGSEYGLYDKLNFVRGLLDTFGVVYAQLWDVDFRKQATRLEVPVYSILNSCVPGNFDGERQMMKSNALCLVMILSKSLISLRQERYR